MRRTDEMTAWKLYNKRWDSTKISTNALGAFEADWGPAKNARLRRLKIEDGEMRLASTYCCLPTNLRIDYPRERSSGKARVTAEVVTSVGERRVY